MTVSAEIKAATCPQCRRYINPISSACVYCGQRMDGVGTAGAAGMASGTPRPTSDNGRPSAGPQGRSSAGFASRADGARLIAMNNRPEPPASGVGMLGATVIIGLGLIFVGGLAAACFSVGSQQYANKKEAVAELKETEKERLKSAQQGKFADDATLDKMEAAASKYAENCSPEERALIEKNVALGRKYRKLCDEINVDPEKVHSQGDVRYSLNQLNSAEQTLKELIKDDPKDEYYKIETEALQILRRRGNFLLVHWGKWSVKDGELYFEVEQSELDKYNKDVNRMKQLQKKKIEMNKRDAKKSIEDLESES